MTASKAKNAAKFIAEYDGSPLRLMEVCGTHTGAIWKSGIRSLIPDSIKLIAGPGCPVCVTNGTYIDKCIDYAMRPNTVLVSYGDMFKVPGVKRGTLSEAKSRGGNVEIMYSPFEVIERAETNPNTLFVITTVGFETTVPAYALLIEELTRKHISNVKLFTSLKSALSAMDWVCTNEKHVDGFLAPGHVSVITGSRAYEPLSEKYHKPFVVGGFEPVHLVRSITELVKIAEKTKSGNGMNEALVLNMYTEAVSESGNTIAQEAIDKYFRHTDASWRGLGTISGSGWVLREAYEEYSVDESDADSIGECEITPEGCRCGDVITGRIDPDECPLFGNVCTPSQAVGPCMVSSEGACGIWYLYRNE